MSVSTVSSREICFSSGFFAGFSAVLALLAFMTVITAFGTQDSARALVVATGLATYLERTGDVLLDCGIYKA